MYVQIRYVKRLIMSFDLEQTPFDKPTIPDGFFWKGWQGSRSDLVQTHAQIIHGAFSNDVDGRIFPTYRQHQACEHLVSATSSAKSFATDATWLIGRFSSAEDNNSFEFCAAIQCVQKNKGVGEIQNVSVLPTVRRMGLGRSLVLKALDAFKTNGFRRVLLEATAENAAAVRLYDSLGFRLIRCLYRESFIESNSSK